MTDTTVLSTDDSVEDAEHVQAVLEKAAQLRANETDDDEVVTPEEDEVTDNEESEDVEYDETEEENEHDDAEEEGADEEESSQDEPEGIDFDALTDEFYETGTLSDDTIDALEATGIPRNIVEAHMAGIQAQAELTRQRAAGSVGGEENLQAILEWAGNNLDEATIDRVNGMVAAGDFEGYLLALEGVRSRYEADFGSLSSSTLRGETTVQADVFESQAQMKEAMRDTRYTKDEAYRQSVAAKLARTRRAGIELS